MKKATKTDLQVWGVCMFMGLFTMFVLLLLKAPLYALAGFPATVMAAIYVWSWRLPR